MLAGGFAESACLVGKMKLGGNVYVAQGSILRSLEEGITIENSSYVLENSVIIGNAAFPTHIKAKTVFGHKSVVIGATIGNLCEIGNNALIMPGAVLGDMCILGEGTLIREGMIVPDGSVVVGRPGRIIRQLTQQDRDMVKRMRGNDITLPVFQATTIEKLPEKRDMMGKLYAYGDKFPQVDEKAVLFPSAEITGDVTVGAKTIIGAGVKIIGDSHGPIRIGSNVQILENTVLHLLPDNELIIEDNVIIGPGCVVHGCHIGKGSVIEPGAIICDNSKLGSNTLVKAGSVVKQKSHFPEKVVVEGFPAVIIATLTEALQQPLWKLDYEKLAER
jgi:carbonic anhydrase/acetyltransferase-like protein (isoleucine patch superfamily)